MKRSAYYRDHEVILGFLTIIVSAVPDYWSTEKTMKGFAKVFPQQRQGEVHFLAVLQNKVFLVAQKAQNCET